MAVTAHVFPQWAQGTATKLQNLSSDTVKVALSNTAGPVTLATSGVQAAKLWTDWTSNVAALAPGRIGIPVRRLTLSVSRAAAASSLASR